MTTGPDPTAPDPARRWTAAELAELSGLSLEDVRAFWWALGLPDAGDDRAWTDDDLATLRALQQTGLGREAVVRVVRALGQSVARMAEWQVMAASSTAIAQGAGPGAAAEALERARPALEQVVAHAWRRHFEVGIARLRTDAAVAAGQDSPPEGFEDPEPTHDLTVGFADLVNFSGLSSTLEVNRIGDMVEVFESRCADVVGTHGGRMIKTIGDAVLFVADGEEGAGAAARIAFGIVEVIGRDPRMPDVRLGLASGPVVSRLGDVFGSPVNLAARLTALARRNRVLVDDATLERLPRGEYASRRLTARPVRGFGLVEPIAIRPW